MPIMAGFSGSSARIDTQCPAGTLKMTPVSRYNSPGSDVPEEEGL
jgi:hypothetical protein